MSHSLRSPGNSKFNAAFEMLKRNFNLSIEATTNWLYCIWCFKLRLWPPRCYSSAETIVVSEAEVDVWEQLSLNSASSRRSQDVWKFSEWRCLQNEEIIHSLCFPGRILLFWRPRCRTCSAVDLKVPSNPFSNMCAYQRLSQTFNYQDAVNRWYDVKQAFYSKVVLQYTTENINEMRATLYDKER